MNNERSGANDGDLKMTKRHAIAKSEKAGAIAFIIAALIGVIIVPADVPEERARQFAEGEIKMLNQYFAGCVYWVRVESPGGFCGVIDDCLGGLYADSAGEAAKEAITDYLDLTDAERAEALAALE